MESEVLKSEVLLENSEYNICCFFLISKKLWLSASLMEQLNVSFLLATSSKSVFGWVILSCKSRAFSIISEFEHHFREISLFVKSTILGKSIFEGLDGIEMWWGKKFIYFFLSNLMVLKFKRGVFDFIFSLRKNLVIKK